MLDAAGSGRMTWQLGSVITSPTISASIMGGGTQFKAPASLTFTTTTSGSVAKIEFWVNGEQKGEITGSTRQWTFSNIQPGNYEVMVRALGQRWPLRTAAPIRFVVA